MIRIVFSLFAGTSIALALFWGMQYMITNNQQGLKKTDNLRMVEFVRLKQESELQTKKRHIPEKPKPKERPEQPKMQMQRAQVTQAALPDMDIPSLDIPLQTNRFTGSILSGLQVRAGHSTKISTNVTPLVKIKPQYPMRARRRRIEGWVKIEFTITKEGTVKDAVVVASEPSSIFNRAALRAIKRWKFKPAISNGVARERRAIQQLDFGIPK